jgi:hypothetical protein
MRPPGAAWPTCCARRATAAPPSRATRCAGGRARLLPPAAAAADCCSRLLHFVELTGRREPGQRGRCPCALRGAVVGWGARRRARRARAGARGAGAPPAPGWRTGAGRAPIGRATLTLPGGRAQEAVRLRPAYADAYTGMGVALKELKRRDEAEACFAQVVRLRPGCALSLGNLAGAPTAQALSATLANPEVPQTAWARTCWAGLRAARRHGLGLRYVAAVCCHAVRSLPLQSRCGVGTGGWREAAGLRRQGLAADCERAAHHRRPSACAGRPGGAASCAGSPHERRSSTG